MTLGLLILGLRIAGGTLLGLSAFHYVLWRALAWDEEAARLSPLNARVFAVHTFFVAFVLAALGALSLARPELLVEESELARLVLSGVVLFWAVRLVLQPIVFDPRMREGGWTSSLLVRGLAVMAFAGYTLVYGVALAHQLGLELPP